MFMTQRTRRPSHCCTFSHERVFAAAGERAVDFADEFHVVEERVEGVEVGEADHVRGAATGCLETANNHRNKNLLKKQKYVHKYVYIHYRSKV